MRDMCSLVRLDDRRVVNAVRDEIADPFSLEKSVHLLVSEIPCKRLSGAESDSWGVHP